MNPMNTALPTDLDAELTRIVDEIVAPQAQAIDADGTFPKTAIEAACIALGLPDLRESRCVGEFQAGGERSAEYEFG